MRREKLRLGEWGLIGTCAASLILTLACVSGFVTVTERQVVPVEGFSALMTGLLLAYTGAYIVIQRFMARRPDNRFVHYDLLMLWVGAFYLMGQVFEIWKSQGGRIPFTCVKTVLSLFLAALFWSFGRIFAHAQRGWFISISNRWTRGSDVVWRQTHRRLAVSLKMGALFWFVQAIVPWPYAFCPAVIAMLLAEYYMFVYPFLLHGKLRTAAKQAPPLP